MTISPEGWLRATLGELSAYVTSGSREWSKYYSDEGALFVRTQDISSNCLADVDGIARMKLPSHVEGKRSLVQEGDLLITITGYVGRCAWVSGALPEAYVSQSVALVRLKDTSIAEFVRWQLLAPSSGSERTELELRGYGLGRSVLSLDSVRSAPILFPPPAEQRRIVAKLSALKARTTLVRAHLDRIPALVERHKEAILTAAFSEAWRSQRERDWPSRASSLGEVAAVTGGKRLPSGHDYSSHSTDFPYLRVSDFNRGSISRESLKYLEPVTASVLSRYAVASDDLCISIAGSIGQVARVPNDLVGGILTENAARIRVDSSTDPNYVFHFLTSPAAKRQISDYTVATAIPKLALFRIEQIHLPVPALDEQREIARRLDSAFAEIDRLAAKAAAARKLLDRLDRAVIAKAFRGELVPQDPTDEPASVMLERIRAERAATPAAKRARRARAA